MTFPDEKHALGANSCEHWPFVTVGISRDLVTARNPTNALNISDAHMRQSLTNSVSAHLRARCRGVVFDEESETAYTSRITPARNASHLSDLARLYAIQRSDSIGKRMLRMVMPRRLSGVSPPPHDRKNGFNC